MTTTLLDRLTAAIDEDERIAREATPGPWRTYDVGDVGVVQSDDAPNGGQHEISMMMRCEEHDDRRVEDSTHIARQNPKATLIRCAAHKRLIADYRAYADAYDYRSSDPVRPEPLLPLWLAVLRVAEGYGLDVQED